MHLWKLVYYSNYIVIIKSCYLSLKKFINLLFLLQNLMVIYSLPSCIDALMDIYLTIASFDVRRKKMLNVIKFLIQYKKDLKGLQSPYKFQNWRVFSGRGPSRMCQSRSPRLNHCLTLIGNVYVCIIIFKYIKIYNKIVFASINSAYIHIITFQI